MVLDNLRQWYHDRVNRVSAGSSSGVLLQVVVLSAMKPARLSPRVILQASIWTVLIIVLAFILLYSILLTYVDRHVAMSPQLENILRSKQYSRKIKFRSKAALGSLRDENDTYLRFRDKNRQVVWNSSNYFNLERDISPVCHNQSFLTIIITSSPEHSHQRNEIRRTWCDPTASGFSLGSWQCVFLIGETSDRLDQTIKTEMKSFGDVLRGTYVDSYRNLTYKVLHGLSWNRDVCPTPYTLKTDDDCFVNILQLYSFLLHTNKVTSDLYVGNVNLNLEKRTVIRAVNSKWAVSLNDYPHTHYPPYASGTGYVLSRDLVRKIVNECRYVKVHPNEDAYIGILVDAIGVKYVSSPRFVLFNSGLRLCNYLYVFVCHGVTAEKQSEVFNQMIEAPKKCSANGDELSTWL